MDEEYILVSKDTIKNYKEQIVNLKKELDQKKEIKPIEKQEPSELIKLIRTEFKEENNIIISHLEDIKELNKSTLDNLLTNTKALDDRLENMIDTISELVKTLSSTLDGITTSNEFDFKMLVSKIEKIPLMQNQTSGNINEIDDIKSKLSEISLFMKNLRILLSYVKPNDIKIEKSM